MYNNRLRILYGCVLLILGGCANTEVQKYFPKPDYTESRQITVVEVEDAEIVSASEEATITEYDTVTFYTAYGPEMMNRLLEEYAANGWTLQAFLPVIEEYGGNGRFYVAGYFVIFTREVSKESTAIQEERPEK